MEADIIENDDVTGRHCRHKPCFDPCFEDAAVHRRIDDPWRGQSMASKIGNEGLGLPMAERSLGCKTTALSGPSGEFCQAGIR